MGLYEIAQLNKEKRFNKMVKKNERELKKCIKENIKNGNAKFTFDAIYVRGIEEENAIYNILMNGILKHSKYDGIYSCLDWHGFGNSHLRLALEIMKNVDI